MKPTLTRAQRRGLELLARPGAEARATPYSVAWWTIWQGDEPIGRAHSESLMALRLADLVAFERDDAGRLMVCQRITDAGRHGIGGGHDNPGGAS